MRFSRPLRKVRGPKLRATLWGNYARRAAAYPSCCRLPVVLPPEKLHVIPPGVFQDLKSDRWNHAVFSAPKKSEGTQITCDIVGELCALCCRLPVVLSPTRRAAAEKLHVIPPGVFQDLKSDCWNHAVFSIPKKSEGTQITCDIVGKLCALCCRLPVVLPPTRRAAAEKLHVIPPGVFQDLKSDRWNHAVFSTPKKSEGTQITCDIVGEPFVGESLGGRSEGLGGRSEGLGGPRRCLGGARPEP